MHQEYQRRHARRRASVLIAALLVTAAPAAAQEDAGGVAWPDHPQLRLGPLVIEGHASLQVDLRAASPRDEARHGIEWERRRAGIRARAWRLVAIEVDRELGDTARPWRDVAAELRLHNALEVRGGRFKVPFGREALTSGTDLPLTVRAPVSRHLAPGRSEGVMLRGRTGSRRLTYAAGWFRDDGDNATPVETGLGESSRNHPMVAGRVTATPLDDKTSAGRLVVGAAFTSGRIAEGLNSVAGETAFGTAFFPPVYVQGTRTRLGAEAAWSRRAWWAASELVRAGDDRHGQGLAGEDLPDLVSTGWYASAGARGRRLAAALRFDHLAFGGGAGSGRRGPRADVILPARRTGWTAAFHWFASGWITIQAMTLRERMSDVERLPPPAREVTWGALCRLQIAI